MKQEDKEFLKQLQHEMLTQDHVCQASPRFWVVMQTVRDYWVEDDVDDICIYDTYGCERVFEGELDNPELVNWLKEEFDIIEKIEYDNGYIEIVCEDESEYFIDSMSEIKDFLEYYDQDRYNVCYYKEREEIAQNTMFLTLRECKEHIERNHYHYNKPHFYAMTAWRSPQVSRLYEILENTDWEKEI